jgi:hypothetical protein
MRALRSSLYVSAYDPPLTTVILESDVIDTLESIATNLPPLEALIVTDIFDSADDIAQATVEAELRRRTNAEQEAHMAMLYYWTVQTWQRIPAGGAIGMPKRAPLSREEIEVVFARLAQHPEYKNFTIIAFSRDGQPVMLANGKIEQTGDAS